MTHGIRNSFTYRKRHEHGTQHPLDTLQTKSGSCRDYALFMIEALRRLGIAARFVSGYLFVPGDSAHGYVGGGSTHAWVQVYLPSAGWIEFDPTNGIVGTRDLVRVAVARDPRQADSAARHLSGAGRCVHRHGRQHQRGVGRRGEGRLSFRHAAGTSEPDAAVEFHRLRNGAQRQTKRGLKSMEIKVGFEISYAAVAPTPMVIMLSIHPSRFPTSSAPRASSPNPMCRSVSTATVLAMSAAA